MKNQKINSKKLRKIIRRANTDCQKAITLISLVVTIVIIIILAGIAINLNLGENGLFSKLKQAKEKYLNSQEIEEKNINDLYSQILIATNDASKVTISLDDLRKIISEEIKNNATTVPTGTIISYMGINAPIGYLFCDGTIYNISEYKNLAEQIKLEFGSYDSWGGDGKNTFAVPNLKGEFLRCTGTNDNSGQGSGEQVGKHQNATIHSNLILGGSSNNYLIQTFQNDEYQKTKNHDSIISMSKRWVNILQSTNGTQATDAESMYTSRPTNTSTLYCIKY